VGNQSGQGRFTASVTSGKSAGISTVYSVGNLWDISLDKDGLQRRISVGHQPGKGRFTASVTSGTSAWTS